MKNQWKTKARFVVRLIYKMAISPKVLEILLYDFHTSCLAIVQHWICQKHKIWFSSSGPWFERWSNLWKVNCIFRKITIANMCRLKQVFSRFNEFKQYTWYIILASRRGIEREREREREKNRCLVDLTSSNSIHDILSLRLDVGLRERERERERE